MKTIKISPLFIITLVVITSMVLTACGGGEYVKSPTEPGGTNQNGGMVASEVNVWDSGNFGALQPIRQAVIFGAQSFFLNIIKDPSNVTPTAMVGMYARSLAVSQADTPGFGPADVLAIMCIAGTTYFAVVYYADHMPAPDWTISGANWPTFVNEATQKAQNLSLASTVTAATYMSTAAVETYGNMPDLSIYGGLGDAQTVYFYQSVTPETHIVATYTAMGQTYFISTELNSSVQPTYSMTAADWFLFYRMAVTTYGSSTVAAPPVQWPAWDPNISGWQHAANSRKWPIQGIMLAYESLTHTADHVYFSPTLGYLLITTYDPYVGSIGGIFTAANDIISAGASSIVPGSPVTIIFPMQSLQAKRIRGCFSYEIWPAFGTYTSQFDPPPVGSGTCKQGNVFNQ